MQNLGLKAAIAPGTVHVPDAGLKALWLGSGRSPLSRGVLVACIPVALCPGQASRTIIEKLLTKT